MRRLVNRQEISKMFNRAPYVLALGTVAILGCWQKLDSNASNDFTPVAADPSGGIGAPFQVVTTTPKIGVTADPATGDPATETDDPCVKLRADALEIRTKNCSGCHQGGSTALMDIENEDSFIDKAASSKFPGWKYVTPGTPETSLIYSRVVMVGDMPPPSTSDSPLPRPTISDMSVLRDWIKCLGTPAPAATGAGGSTGGGTSTGAGGSTGGGTSTGAGGSTGTGAGGRTGAGGMAAGTGGATGTTPGMGGAVMADAGGTSTDAGGMSADSGTMTGSDGGAASACAGIQNCNNPTVVATLPFNTTVTAQQACFEVNRAVSAINCNNASGRRITVNMTQLAVNNAGMCNGTLPAARNGGFCVQVNAGFGGGGQQQPPATTLNIL